MHGNDYIAHIITATLVIFGLPGNILVIILILRAKEKKSTTTCLLLSLAIADVVHLLGTVILNIVADRHHDEKRPPLMLLVVPARIVVNFILALLALERYNALVRTMKPLMNFTRKKVIRSVIIAWFTALILWLPLILIRIANHDKGGHSDTFVKIFKCLTVIFGYVVPLLVVVFCYSSILKGLYLDRTVLAEKISNEATLRDKKRLIRILVVITIVFVACNLPKIVIIMAKKYVFKKIHHLHIVLILGCLSSSLNPYIYALHSENYRSQIKQLFCKKTEEENVELSPDIFDTKL